jgi:hypothetical protein
MKRMVLAVAICGITSPAFTTAQDPLNHHDEKTKPSEAACPMHDTHARDASSSAALNHRGELGMGFSQTATTHHFLIKPTGGVIQVEVNDSADATSRDNIRKHLAHIAQTFKDGDFNLPMLVHDTVPPGVPEMKRLRDKITYSFEETPNGGRVVIATTDKESLAAIHKFLQFQIGAHKTGDSI